MRDPRIDLLRFIGLIMIILAHCDPNPIIFQIRNFDVPLMVLVSGMSFKLSFRKDINFSKYFWKRIKRLLFPVWIFLSLFFLSTPFIGFNFTPKKIITSYLLLDGIGFLWVIRVFLMIALIAPFLIKIEQKYKSTLKLFLSLIVAFLGYEIFTKISYNYFQSTLILKTISSIIYYIIPYSIVYIFGIRLYSITKKNILKISLFFLLILITTGISLFLEKNRFVPTQLYKYPLSTYYLSYALFLSLIVWTISDAIWDNIHQKIKAIILFMASNSIWIYLWHIPLIFIIKHTHFHFSLEYLFVILTSTTITFVQIKTLENFILPKIKTEKIKKNIRILFTG